MKLPKYHGIIPPMITPLGDRDALDAAGLERLIEYGYSPIIGRRTQLDCAR